MSVVDSSGFFDHEFWINFWSNVLSDLLVGIVIAGVVSWIIAKSKRIDAKVVGTLRQLGPADFQLNLAVKNSGKQNFGPNEIFAHVFVTNTLAPKNLSGAANASPMTIDGTAYTDFVTLMPLPCFPGRATDLLDLHLGADALSERSVLFFLSTAYGFFPRHLKVTEDGSIAVKGLGVVSVQRANT